MADIVLVQLPTSYMDVFEGKPTIPLGLLSICRYIHQDYNIKILDVRYEHNWKKVLTEEVNQQTVCVALSCMTGSQILTGIEISKWIKKNSRIPVVWGGPHASILPQQTLSNDYIDFVIQGEGEIAFRQLVDALKNRTGYTNIEGLWWKDKGSISNGPVKKALDLNQLPPIPWHLINMENYIQNFQNRRSIPIETSRGCPQRCAYCYHTSTWRMKWRGLSAEKTLEMIKHLKTNYSVETFIFNDDNYFVDISRAKEIASKIISNKLDIKWYPKGVYAEYLKDVDDEFFSLLMASGCIKFKIGVESGSKEIRKLINKKGEIDEIRKLNRRLAKFQLPVVYNFMCGFPSETVRDIKKSVDFMFHLLKENPHAQNSAFLVYTPYPGTQLYDFCQTHNFIAPKKLEDWGRFNVDDTDSKSWLTKKQKKMLRGLYLSSIFITNRTDEFGVFHKFPFLNVLRKIYSPVARFRVKNLYFKFLFESAVKNIFEEILNKRNQAHEHIAY